jgi:NAD(P)-dependent dehydrogenase (short-subunit alcohol dehydrogenase family)
VVFFYASLTVFAGGANGIGKALVELLHRKGAIIYFCDVDTQKGALLVRKFAEYVALSLSSVEATENCNRRAHFSVANVTDWRSMSLFFAQVYQSAGTIDMVFANAGIIMHETIWVDDCDTDGNLSPPDLLTMDVCLKGAIFSEFLRSLPRFLSADTSSVFSHFASQPPNLRCRIFGGTALRVVLSSLPRQARLIMNGHKHPYTARASTVRECSYLHFRTMLTDGRKGILGLMRSLRSWAPREGVHVACVAPGGTGMLWIPLPLSPPQIHADTHNGQPLALHHLLFSMRWLALEYLFRSPSMLH